MSKPGIRRFTWLARRLSRMYPAEVPYRVLGVLRGAAQGRGWFDASSPPSLLLSAGRAAPWVRAPADLARQAGAVVDAAERMLQGGVTVFDTVVALGEGGPAWNRDPRTGIEVADTFGLDIDFRHLGGGIDIKYLWELNRHLWWVTLAQAWRASDDERYLHLLARLLESWLAASPYPLGANWSSPVEHGIRLVNWSIVWHLIGAEASPMFASRAGARLRERWIDSVYQHIRFASDNYSFYSSSDNHLIGEAAGVFVGAHTWDLWADTRQLRERAKAILEEEMLKQFAADGVNLEQSTCYHRFSLEFLLAALLCGSAAGDAFSDAFCQRMYGAIVFIASMMNSAGGLGAIGDSDDGAVFAFSGDGAASPYHAMLGYGARLFGSKLLRDKLDALGASHLYRDCWLAIPAPAGPALPAPAGQAAQGLPTAFPLGGYLILGCDLHGPEEFRVTFDVGALGYNRIAGHGHADTLAILLSSQGEDFLIDPGTYCYNAAPELRHYFRSTCAHNTACIDDTDQSLYGGSFLWLRDVAVTLLVYDDDGATVIVEASHNGYRRLPDPVRHVRRISLDRRRRELLVEDRFECADRHRCGLHWHFAPECEIEGEGVQFTATRSAGRLAIAFDAPGLAASMVCGRDSPPLGWASRSFYRREPTCVLALAGLVEANATITTRFSYSPSSASPDAGARPPCASGLN